jgi:hypothetical protein
VLCLDSYQFFACWRATNFAACTNVIGRVIPYKCIFVDLKADTAPGLVKKTGALRRLMGLGPRGPNCDFAAPHGHVCRKKVSVAMNQQTVC